MRARTNVICHFYCNIIIISFYELLFLIIFIARMCHFVIQYVSIDTYATAAAYLRGRASGRRIVLASACTRARNFFFSLQRIQRKTANRLLFVIITAL